MTVLLGIDWRYPWNGKTAPRDNISPGQQVDVVHIDRGRPTSRKMRWGWHNKRIETINTVEADHAYHKLYQQAWKTRRCLIPAVVYFQSQSVHPFRVAMVTE